MDGGILNAITSLASITGTVLVAFFCTRKANDKKALIEGVTEKRMIWLSEVRELLYDFLETFRLTPDNLDELKKIRTKLLLYMRADNECYQQLLVITKKCCYAVIPEEEREAVYRSLIIASEYVLATVWVRVKAEGTSGETHEDVIMSKVDKNTENLKKRLDIEISPKIDSIMDVI